MNTYNEVLNNIISRTGLDLNTETPDFEVDVADAVLHFSNLMKENSECTLNLDVNKDLTEFGKLSLESLEFYFSIYLKYLAWKFPESDKVPFTIITGLPVDQQEFVTWFLMTLFITISADLAKNFKTGSTIPKDKLKVVLENKKFLNGKKFNLNSFANNKYFFVDCVIQFK